MNSKASRYFLEDSESGIKEAVSKSGMKPVRTAQLRCEEILCRRKLGTERGSVFVFGREMAEDSSVSRRHFEISCFESDHDPTLAFWLKDCGSSNGTYLNSFRIEPGKNVLLKKGDWIFASGFSFFYFPGILFSTRKMAGFASLARDRLLKTDRSGHTGSSGPALYRQEVNFTENRLSLRKDIAHFQPGLAAEEILQLEAPDSCPETEKPSWFSSLGSSALILISSMSSLLAMVLRNPQDHSSIAISGVTSLSMAAAFLAYGLINRKLTISSYEKKKKRIEKEYRDYLLEQKTDSENRIQKEDHDFQALLWILKNLDPDLQRIYSGPGEYEMPIRIHTLRNSRFQLPNIRYSQRKDPLYQDLIGMGDLSAKRHVFEGMDRSRILLLEPLSFQRRWGLVCGWLWMSFQADRKWVWVIDRKGQSVSDLKRKIDQNLFWHPAFSLFWKQVAPLPLIFGSIHELNESQILKESENEWLIYVLSDLNDDLLSENLEELQSQALARIPESVSSSKQISWIFECAGEENPFEDLDFELAGPDGGMRMNDPSEEDPLVLLDHWSETDPKKLRKTLQIQESKKPEEDWDPGIFSKSAEADLFRSPQANLKVRLSSAVTWDLQEDGPHALIAGSTGSGKSEGLISVLLQLLLNNTPEQLQLICIDFKGSALASVLSPFEHMAGMITNLEAGAFERLQKALEKELEKRQILIRDWLGKSPYSAGDVLSYNESHPDHPISHLIIAVDEFAQLKTRYPEAMKMLQESARIGRSLGIHLILCTQKPAGVVDEQIWTNARSHLCFRVQSAQDSREMLGNDQASRLKRPGEFILQVSGQENEQTGMALYSRKQISTENSVQILSEQTGVKPHQSNDPCQADDTVLEDLLALRQKAEQGRLAASEQTAAQKPGTVQERISGLILEDQNRRKKEGKRKNSRWILHPDFYQSNFGRKMALTDCIDHMEEFSFGRQKASWLLLPPALFLKIEKIIFRTSEIPVLLCKADSETGSPRYSETDFPVSAALSRHPEIRSAERRIRTSAEISRSELWNLIFSDQELLILIEADERISPPLMERLMENPKNHLVFISSSISGKMQPVLRCCEIRMASSVEDKEQIFNLFQKSGMRIPDFPEFSASIGSEENLRICLNQKAADSDWTDCMLFAVPAKWLSNPIDPENPVLRRDYPFLIGFERSQETFMPICWDGGDLLIAYRSEQGREMAEELLNFWSAQDPELSWGWFPEKTRISIIELPESQHLLMDEKNEKQLYSRQILFIGDGISSSQYLLKKQVPLELYGNSVLFQKENAVCLDCTEFSGKEKTVR